jgi:hypothetical protein
MPWMMRALMGLSIVAGQISGASAQDSTLYIYGSIKGYGTGKPLEAILVQAIDRRDTSVRILARTNAQGRYELLLHAGRDNAVVFQAVGYITKHVLIDLQGPTASQWKDGFAMQIDMMLFQPMDGVDMSVLKEPVGKCRFNPRTGLFEWDRSYADSLKPRMKALTDAVDERSQPVYPGPLMEVPIIRPDTTKH